MRGFLTVSICAAAILVAGCGSGDDDETGEGSASETSTASKTLPAGCGLDDVESVLTGFMDAVNAGDAGATARYVAPQPELAFLSLSASRGSDAVEVRSPAAAYDAMREFTAGERFRLLAAGVGLAPREELRSGPRADDPALGADFTYVSKKRWISGKLGLNCATGQIYLAPMGIEPGEPRAMVVCGRRVPVSASEPYVCEY